MLFSSLTFLYFFLPAVLLCYFIAPARYKNAVLLIFSLLFYAWGEPKYVFLMAATVALGWAAGLMTEKSRGTKASRLWLLLAVGSVLLLLGIFKYADFFIESFSAATGLSVPLLRLALPVGISFYSFQLISYLVDVYRATVPAQRSPVKLAAYICMFPQLIAGPIVRYSDIAPKLDERCHSFDMAASGITRFMLGLGKKVIIANSMGALCSAFQQSAERSVLFFWLYAIAFTLQIYYDFSGYSDMAIGLGRILGFKFMENFNYPYISRSITEFWRRWHISLGSWFRDYLYIPLGGNRVSKPRWFFNIFVVWFCTGFWHGADWNFMLWGLYFAVLLVLEKLWLLKLLEKSRILSHAYTLLLVIMGFVLFNSASLPEAISCIGGLFGIGAGCLAGAESLYYLRSYALLLILAILGATPLVKLGLERLGSYGSAAVLRPLGCLALLAVCTAYLVDGSFNPFLYFRF